MSSQIDPNSNSLPTWEQGIIGGYNGHSTAITRAIMAFTAIAWYNCGEIMILIAFTFKKYSGTYFWSLLVTSVAILIYSVGAWGKLEQITKHNLITLTFQNVGWIVMVTGQSMVLYSRLYIITQNRKLLKCVLYAIIVNSILMFIPTSSLNYASTITKEYRFTHGYSIMERIQMSIFSTQELVISGIYLWQVAKFLRAFEVESGTRKILWEMVLLNVILVLLDVSLLSVEFLNLYEVELSLKGFVYSVKLKLELGLLNKLVKLVQRRSESRRISQADDVVRFGSYGMLRSPNNTCGSSMASPHKLSFMPSSIPTLDLYVTSEGRHDFEAMLQSNEHGLPEAGMTIDEKVATAIPTLDAVLQLQQRLSDQSSLSSDEMMYPGRLDGRYC